MSEKRIPKCNSKINQLAAGENIFGKNTVAETSFFKFSQPAVGEKHFGENTVPETSFPDEERKRSLRQKNWLFIYKKKWKDNVSVTVNSVAPLHKKTSQSQTFGEMKLKIKKTKKKKTIGDGRRDRKFISTVIK